MNDYIEFINTDDFYIELIEKKSTKKDSIVESFFYKINEMLFLMTLFYKKLVPKIFGFRANSNQQCIPEEYKENQKIDILKYQFNSKHLVFYQSKDCLEPSFKHLIFIGQHSFWQKRFIEIIEKFFYSYINISFKSSFNFIKIIIIGLLEVENLYAYNCINNEKTKFIYKFHNILFVLSFDYYYFRKSDKKLIKMKLKIYFPEINKYSSYFSLFIEKYINKYSMNKYDCNSIFKDILSKRQKFIFIYQSKKSTT